MNNLRKHKSVTNEPSSYETRVQRVADDVASQHDAAPFANNNDVVQAVNDTSGRLSVVDYSLGGNTRRSFVKDVLDKLKGKIKTGRTKANTSDTK